MKGTMLEPITGLPEGTVGFRAIGEITADDYRNTLIPDLDEALMDHKKVRLLFEAGPEFKGYEAGAMWEDLKLGVDKFNAFERVVLVTDFEWMRRLVAAFGFITPVELKVFGLADEDAARQWLVRD